MTIGAIILFGITFAGVFIACKVFAYEISIQRKAGSALCFAVLNVIPIPIPIPFISVLVPAVGLYMCLMDDTYDRSTVTKVFFLTFFIAIIGVIVVYNLRAAG